MRAPYNVLLELWSPLAAGPPTLLGQFAGRVVFNNQIRVQNRPYFKERGYATTDSTAFIAASVLHVGTQERVDTATTHRIACPAAGLGLTPVLWVETVTPSNGPAYVRVHFGPWVV